MIFSKDSWFLVKIQFFSSLHCLARGWQDFKFWPFLGWAGGGVYCGMYTMKMKVSIIYLDKKNSNLQRRSKCLGYTAIQSPGALWTQIFQKKNYFTYYYSKCGRIIAHPNIQKNKPIKYFCLMSGCQGGIFPMDGLSSPNRLVPFLC